MFFGTLTINSNVCRLKESDSVLARCSEADPLGQATQFLKQDKGLKEGDFIQVTGTLGSVGRQPVICIIDASKATAASASRTIAAMRKAAAK